MAFYNSNIRVHVPCANHDSHSHDHIFEIPTAETGKRTASFYALYWSIANPYNFSIWLMQLLRVPRPTEQRSTETEAIIEEALQNPEQIGTKVTNSLILIWIPVNGFSTDLADDAKPWSRGEGFPRSRGPILWIHSLLGTFENNAAVPSTSARFPRMQHRSRHWPHARLFFQVCMTLFGWVGW